MDSNEHFERYDSNGDGFISKDEVRRVFATWESTRRSSISESESESESGGGAKVVDVDEMFGTYMY